jgi:thymidylate synthase (FAD)
VSEIKVLDHGFVRLDGALADDLSVVNSARVSFASRSELVPEVDDDEQGTYLSGWRLSDKDTGLIRFLMRNRHGTPFEHNMFRFHVKAPIMVFREWQRHRISSYNEWSARYSQLEPEFYIPKPEHVRSQVGKPGAYTFERVEAETANTFRASLKLSSEIAYGEYEDAISKGIAKEQARLFLPVNIYSQMYWTVNARSLMNFLSLRNSEHAMFEIAEYAQVIESIFRDLMPVTAEAFVLNGRNAP